MLESMSMHDMVCITCARRHTTTHPRVREPLAAAYGYINLSGRGPDNQVPICLGSQPSIDLPTARSPRGLLTFG